MASMEKSLAYPMCFWGGITTTILGIKNGDSEIITYGLIIAIIFSLSIVFFFHAFKKDEKDNLNLKFFVLLCFTNPILVFDNLNIIDYPISLFFFSLGCFFASKKEYILMSIFFGICLGCRINFALFILIHLIFFYSLMFFVSSVALITANYINIRIAYIPFLCVSYIHF